MGWKIVRDRAEAPSRSRGISGVWRKSPDPVSGLCKKLLEEVGEFLEHRDPAELYDLLDVVSALIVRLDDDCKAAEAHLVKTAAQGYFTEGIEWAPVTDGKEP